MQHLLVLCVTLNLLFFINSAYSTVSISAKYENVTAGTVNFNVKQSFQLSCNTSEKVDVKWEKNNETIDKISSLKGRYSTVNKGTTYLLNIQSANEDDAGSYVCTAYENGVKSVSAKIDVGSNIAVKVQSNINVIEGDKLQILCHVIGEPSLSWYYQNDTFNETYKESSGRIILEKDPDKKIENAVLRMEEVFKYDRGHFTCIGTSMHGKIVKSTSFLRIKDKYAALWPFLGICAEVFVLCTIIFIYEKKRNKTELEESDTDQSPDQKTPADNGKEQNIRHRK